MKKLVEVSFNSKKEFSTALMDGRVFRSTKYSSLMYWDQALVCTSPFRLGEVCMDGVWESYRSLYEEITPTWQEDLDKGTILCWVTNDKGLGAAEEETQHILLKHGDKYLDSNGGYWIYAEPVTADDIWDGET